LIFLGGHAGFGEVDFGPEASKVDPYEIMLRWYDHLLKGIENGIDKEMPVRIFVMGKNVWRDEDEWPPAGPFNIFWHTPFDTVGRCSALSLGIVGRVLLDAMDDLESGRTPKPLFAFLESGAAGGLRQRAGR